MNIELIDNKSFSEVWIDGRFWRKIHKKFYHKYLHQILQSPSKKDLRDLLLRIDIKIATGVVYKLLAVRGYMKSELIAKLKRYEISSGAIDKVLRECEKLGYLDDQKECELMIAREKRRGLGPQMIAYKLEQKAPELVEMVATRVSSEDQVEAIKKWIQKKTKRDDFDQVKVKHRLYRFLKGKGFDDDLIRQELFTP